MVTEVPLYFVIYSWNKRTTRQIHLSQEIKVENNFWFLVDLMVKIILWNQLCRLFAENFCNSILERLQTQKKSNSELKPKEGQTKLKDSILDGG